jgi:hypothetical protein
MSDAKAGKLGIQPLAPIVATEVAALEPEHMGLGPIPAMAKVLKRTRMEMADIDIVEINEAFAAQVIPSARSIGLDPMEDRFNPLSRSIALGHPFWNDRRPDHLHPSQRTWDPGQDHRTGDDVRRGRHGDGHDPGAALLVGGASAPTSGGNRRQQEREQR